MDRKCINCESCRIWTENGYTHWDCMNKGISDDTSYLLEMYVPTEYEDGEVAEQCSRYIKREEETR